MNLKPKKTKIKPVVAWAIFSDVGIMYDGNGKSMALAIYPDLNKISLERRGVMAEDKIIKVLIKPI